MGLPSSTSLLNIVGAFNEQIFRDVKWLKKYIFTDYPIENIHINLNLNVTNGIIVTTIKCDKATIKFSPSHMEIIIENLSPCEYTDEDFDFVSQLIENIASTLPHTPIVAFGVNFLFSRDITSKIFNYNSIVAPFEDQKITNIQQTQQIKKNGYTVNCYLEQQEVNDNKIEVKILLNYHYNIPTMSEDNPMTFFKNLMLDNCIKKHKESAVAYFEKTLKNV